MKAKITGYDREALKEFKVNLRETQKDVDEVLDAAKLQRTAKQPMFSSKQVMAMLFILMICILSGVGAVCVTLASMAEMVAPILGGTLLLLFIFSLIIFME